MRAWPCEAPRGYVRLLAREERAQLLDAGQIALALLGEELLRLGLLARHPAELAEPALGLGDARRGRRP